MSKLIRFLNDDIEHEFEDVHPEASGLVVLLAHHVATLGWASPFVTHVKRVKEDQRRIYVPYGKRLFVKVESGVPLSKTEQREVSEIRAYSSSRNISLDAAISEWAFNRPSWHLHLCAVDLRNWVWNPDQLQSVIAFLRNHAKNGEWEILAHDVGRGFHLHIARRDAEWRDAHALGAGHLAS